MKNKNNMDKIKKLNQEVAKIHSSTKVLLPPFSILHHFLQHRFPWYYTWHLSLWARVLHWVVLFLYIISVGIASFFFSLSPFWEKEKVPLLAAGTVVQTSSKYTASVFSHQRGKVLKASDGTLIVIYQAGTASPQGLAFSRSTDNGQTWSSGTQIDSSQDVYPSAIILSNNDIIVAYAGDSALYNDPSYSVRVRRLTWNGVSQTWTVGSVITAVPTGATTGSSLVSLAQDASGYFWIAFRYTTDSGTNWQIAVVRSTNANDETAWGSPIILSGSDSSYERAPTLVPYGTKLAAIYTEFSTTKTLKWRWRNNADPEGTWQNEEVIHTYTGCLNDFREFSAVADDAGQIWLLHMQNCHVKYRVYTTSWSGYVTLSPGNDSHPNIATDGTNLWAFWTHWTGAYYQIIYKKYEGGIWGGEISFIADGLNNRYLSTISKDTSFIPLIWTEGTASPYNLKFSKIAVLNTPTIGTPSNVTTTSITWNWTDNSSNESGFRIHDSSDNVKGTVGANVQSWTESSLSPNTAYTRHVHGYNTYGDGDPSGSVTKWTLANAPTNPQASGGWDVPNGYKVTVSWFSGGSQDHFHVYRNGPSGSGTLVYDSTGTSFVDANRSANTTYSYYIYSVNGEGMENGGFIWTQKNANGASGVPVQRGDADHALTYDSTNNKVVLFGGFDGSNYRNDTWTYDLASNTWTQKNANGAPGVPAARGDHALTYDSANQKVVLFGGWYASARHNDTWVYDLASNTWTQKNTDGAPGVPAARDYHDIVYDSANQKVVLFGGWYASARHNDTWVYDLASNTWTQKNTDGAPGVPAARNIHALTYDSTNNKVVLFGGSDGSNCRNDTWIYDTASNTWTQKNANGAPGVPAARGDHEIVYDSVNNKVVLFGGSDGSSERNDTWFYDTAANTWTQKNANGAPGVPAARTEQGLAYDSANQKVVLFGGRIGTSRRNDTWVYDLPLIVSAFTPPAAPVIQSPSSDNPNTIYWWWASVPGATSYILHGGSNPGDDNVIQTGITGTNYNEPNLSSNTRYYRHVHAVNASGEGAPSNEVTKWTLANAPTNPSAVGGWDQTNGYKVTVSWSSGGSQDHFHVYRNGPSGTGTLVYNSTATSFVNGSLSPNTAYTYYIYAVNGEGVENIETARGSLIVQDNFNRPNQSGWGTADLGGNWTTPEPNYWEIVSNEGQGSADAYRVGPYIYGEDVADAEILATIRAQDTYRNSAGISLRRSTSQNTSYSLTVYIRDPSTNSSLELIYVNNGNETQIGSAYKTIATDINYKMRFRVIGTSLKAKIWPASESEPGSWDFSVTHSTLTTGRFGAYQEGWGVSWWDDYSVWRIDPASATTPPSAPTMNSPSNVTTSSIQWNWSSVAGATGYKIYNASNGALIGTTSETSYDETGLTSNTLYSRYLRAYNSSGQGAPSSWLSKYTLASLNINTDKSTERWYQGGSSFNFTTTFGGGNVSSIKYAWNTNSDHSFSGSESPWTSGTLTVSPTSTGNYYLHLQGFNAEGVISETKDIGPFKVDATPPSDFGLLSPEEGSWNNTSPVFLWNKSSDSHSGLAKYQLYLDGELDQNNISPEIISISPKEGLSEGIHNWSILAIDKVGNSTKSEGRTIKVDVTAPSSSVSSPVGGERFEVGQEVTISGQASDNLSGVTKLEISTDSETSWETLSLAGQITSSWSYTWKITSASEHTILTKAYDLAGNVEAAKEGPKILVEMPPLPERIDKIIKKGIEIIKRGGELVEKGAQEISSFVQKNPTLSAGILGTGAVAGAAVPLATSGLPATIGLFSSTWNLFYFIYYLFGLLMQALGVWKKPPLWGVVYDSYTKKPLRYALVRLCGPIFRQVVTDSQGRFGFVVEEGTYELKVQKAAYLFPSGYLLGHHDIKYDNLYFGEKINVRTSKQLINCNIPLDPLWISGKEKFHLGVSWKTLRHLLAYLGFICVFLSFILSLALFISQKKLAFGVLSLVYGILFLVNLANFVRARRLTLPLGKILDALSQKPIPEVILDLFRGGELLESHRASSEGEYNFFVLPGEYTLKARKPNYIFVPKKTTVEEEKEPYIKEKIYGQRHKGYSPQ